MNADPHFIHQKLCPWVGALVAQSLSLIGGDQRQVAVSEYELRLSPETEDRFPFSLPLFSSSNPHSLGSSRAHLYAACPDLPCWEEGLRGSRQLPWRLVGNKRRKRHQHPSDRLLGPELQKTSPSVHSSAFQSFKYLFFFFPVSSVKVNLASEYMGEICYK